MHRRAQPGSVELVSSSQEGKSIFQCSGQRKKMTDLEFQCKDEGGISSDTLVSGSLHSNAEMSLWLFYLLTSSLLSA